MTIHKRTKTGLWLTDHITENESHDHRIKGWKVRRRTKFQKVAFAESYSYGMVLVLDDDIQSAEGDEFIYHEALVHPAMVMHGDPKRVLILGGGEGATLREVLRHPSVRKATMVDIDGEVIDLCREYMPGFSAGAFDDKRADLVVGDAIDYVHTSTERFDVIFSDLSSPVRGGPAYKLYTQEFYRVMKTRLAPGGVFCAQVDSCSITNIHVPAAILNTLSSVFPDVRLYTSYVPSFDALWGFGLASDKRLPADIDPAEVDRRLAGLGGGPLRYYDGQTHTGMFGVPKHVREAVARSTDVITEAKPIFIYK